MVTCMICRECGKLHKIWIGKCGRCGSWGSLCEAANKDMQIVKKTFLNIEYESTSVIMIYGDPGVGKTTLAMDFALEVGKEALYISTEQPEGQLKRLCERIKNSREEVEIRYCKKLEECISCIEESDKKLIVFDSLQGIRPRNEFSLQSRQSMQTELIEYLQEYSYMRNNTIVVINHQTKNENSRGPRYYEHLVDIVVRLRGRNENKAISIEKNRFGPTGYVKEMVMTREGLKEKT